MGSTAYVIESALLLIVVFLLGCYAGYLLRRWFGAASPPQASPMQQAAPSVTPAPEQRPAPPVSPMPAAAPAARPKPAATEPGPVATPAEAKPATLAAPRQGGKDDLKQIKGIGPKIEGMLNGLGIYHFDQIAAWTRKETAWVDDRLSFRGRIDRENWVSQAKALAKDK